MTRRIQQLAVALVIFGTSAALAVEPINVSGRDGVALHGYDAVSYFDDAPRLGDKELTYDWMGAIWRFASAENRDRFAADPERFAPQYGGYCAFAVSKGRTADVDPKAWTVYEGKLYLNYSKFVRARWRLDIPGNVAKADRNWPKLLAE